MKLLIVSFCTSGIMREHFISYAKAFSQITDLYCATNDNIKDIDLLLPKEKVLNLSFKREKPFSYFSPLSRKKFSLFLKRVAPDFIYIFTPHPTNIIFFNIYKKYYVAYQIHDPICHSGTSLLDKIVLKLQLSLLSSIAKVLFVAGDSLKNQALSVIPRYSEKVVSIPFAFVDENLLSFKPKHDHPFDILFFGRIEKYKGLDILIEALKKTKSKPTTIIAGKGDFDSLFGTDYKSLSNVKLINRFVPESELAYLLANCKIVVLPYNDATGSVTIPIAFAFGKPVVATDVGVFKEYIDDCGIIVPPGDSDSLANGIDTLTLNTDVYIEKKKRVNSRFTQFFDIDKICKQHLSKLEECLQNESKKDL